MSGYCLIVAGEVSGDRLGEAVVTAVRAAGWRALGAGGPRMRSAGLEVLVPFEDLGVNGVGDVLCRLLVLQGHLAALCRALVPGLCRALFCVDYPGFNMRLTRRARALNIPVFWVAPPQIWAWRSGRARWFKDMAVAVFFPFEEEAYRRVQARVSRVAHPLVGGCSEMREESVCEWGLVFPGSRRGQALRNLSWIRLLGSIAGRRGARVRVIAASENLAREFRRRLAGSDLMVYLRDDPRAMQGARWALTVPGTATLDLALSGIPYAVIARLDPLTYVMGRLFLRLKSLSLPNLILAKRLSLETYWCWPLSPRASRLAKILETLDNTKRRKKSVVVRNRLMEILGGQETITAWATRCLAAISGDDRRDEHDRAPALPGWPGAHR